MRPLREAGIVGAIHVFVAPERDQARSLRHATLPEGHPNLDSPGKRRARVARALTFGASRACSPRRWAATCAWIPGWAGRRGRAGICWDGEGGQIVSGRVVVVPPTGGLPLGSKIENSAFWPSSVGNHEPPARPELDSPGRVTGRCYDRRRAASEITLGATGGLEGLSVRPRRSQATFASG